MQTSGFLSPFLNFELWETSQVAGVVGDHGIAFGSSRCRYKQVSQLQTLILLLEVCLGFGRHFSSFGIKWQVSYSCQQFFSLGFALSSLFAAGVAREELAQHQFIKGDVRNHDSSFLKSGKGLQCGWLKADGRNQKVGIQNVFAHRDDFRAAALAKASASWSVKESRSFATHAFMAGSLNLYSFRTLLREYDGAVLLFSPALTAMCSAYHAGRVHAPTR